VSVGCRAAPAGLLWVLLSGSPLSAQDAATQGVGIDHIILKVTDLTRGIAAFTRLTGVAPKRGGQHPGRGTENALVSLGPDHYLEILAPIGTVADSAARVEPDTATLVPAGWAVHTRALESLIARVGSAGFALVGPTPGSRRTPEGTLLEWRTAGASGPGLELAPFFIEWGTATAHPSGTSPRGCRLVSLELAQPDTTRLSAFLQAAGYRPNLRAAKEPGMRVALDCPRGRVSLSSQRR
jgi:hypothetical protein